jgi:hypothetical protein
MRDPGYCKWVRMRSCAVFAFSPNDVPYEACGYWNGVSDGAHTENNGMRSKGPDSSRAPLCRKHHREYDAGRAAFEKKYGVDMKAIAASGYAVYQLGFSPVPKHD